MMTLKGLRNHNAEILAICNKCNRSTSIKRETMIPRFGENHPVPPLAKYFKCSGCGSKDVQVRPDFPPVISSNMMS